MLMRRKSSRRSSIASGTIPTAAITKAGASRRKSSVVGSPNRGVVTNGARKKVASISVVPTSRASIAALWTWA